MSEKEEKKKEKKERRKLTSKQIELLYLIFQYRFVTAELVAELSEVASGTAHIRLRILEREGYIGRRYDSTYRLKGKAARYYLLPLGFNALKKVRELDPSVVKQLYNDRRTHDEYVDRQVLVMQAATHLRGVDMLSGSKLYTKSELILYDGLPEYLPDAVFVTAKSQKTLYIDVIANDEPRFVILRKLRSYIAFEESGDWQTKDGRFPVLLFVCERDSQPKVLAKKMRQLLYSQASDIRFGVGSVNAIRGGEKRPWYSNDEEDTTSLMAIEAYDF